MKGSYWITINPVKGPTPGVSRSPPSSCTVYMSYGHCVPDAKLALTSLYSTYVYAHKLRLCDKRMGAFDPTLLRLILF